MTFAVALAFAAVLLCGLAVLPGCLGILKFTHRLTAHPLGGRLFVALPPVLYTASLVLLGVAAFLILREEGLSLGGASLGLLGAIVAFVALSVFGFLMHMRFMFRPVREPRYLTLDEAVERFGEDEEVAGVIDREGRPWAYIARLARRPHIVHQPEGDTPFLMSHCILSHSSMAYATDGRFRGERIYISSVLANNLVFYDAANRCSVLQIENGATDGSYALDTLPTLMTRLGTWKRYYPDSKIWFRPQEWRDTFYLKLLARASVIDSESPDLVYPLERPADERLSLKTYVLGVSLGKEARAYPHERFRSDRVVEDTVGGESLVFLASPDAELVQLFSRRLGERTLSFRAAGDRFEDTETGSVWEVTGRCLEGEMAGQELAPVPHYNKIFWCVWADFFPGTEVYGEAGKLG